MQNSQKQSIREKIHESYSKKYEGILQPEIIESSTDWLTGLVFTLLEEELARQREEVRKQTLKDVNDYLILNYKMTIEEVDDLLLALKN